MNREILFRGFNPCENGKDKVFINGEWINGEWVYGLPSYDSDGHVTEISVYKGLGCSRAYKVISETIGQYTGKNDNTGKKVFVGDIVFDIKGDKHIVTWASREAMYKCVCIGQTYKIGSNRQCDVPVCAAKRVVGNIHSNPEMLEVSE